MPELRAGPASKLTNGPPEQAALELQSEHAPDPLVEPRAADLPAAHRVQHRVVGDVQADRVGRRVSTIIGMSAPAWIASTGTCSSPYFSRTPAMLRASVTTTPPIAKLLTEQPGHDLAVERGRVAALLGLDVAVALQALGHDHVRGHHHVRARRDAGPEGRRVGGLPLLAVVEDPRDSGVAVGDRVAVARESASASRRRRCAASRSTAAAVICETRSGFSPNERVCRSPG